MEILKVKNFYAGYENGFVVKNISFEIRRGEMVCILGRNGSGKSTLIKGIQKLIPNVKGDVFVFGEKIIDLNSRKIAQKISYVPQLSDFIFQFTVRELVEMARYVYQGKIAHFSQRDWKEIEEAMKLTEVNSFQKRKIAQLSGGERKRVLIARALAQDTPLIFLDEPSAHLDLNYQIEIYELLHRLQKEKRKTILCAEHNINLVIPYCDRIIFLKDGEIFEQGKPSEIINQENIEEVYNVRIKVRKNPDTDLPEVSLFKKQEAGSKKQEKRK